jgi:NADH-quinone oxidoreductase subunit L
VIFLTFFGKPSSAAEKAHESGTSMTGPLVVLAIGSVVVGYFAGDFAGLYGEQYHFHVGMPGILGTSLGIAGLVLAWLVYGRRSVSTAAFAALAPIGNLARSGAIDRLYEAMFHRILLAFADVIGWIDRYLVDGMVNLTAWSSIKAGHGLRRVQSGNVQDYVYAVVAGTLALVVWGLWP